MISSVTTSTTTTSAGAALRQMLQSNGLSAAKAKTVEQDIANAAAASFGANPGESRTDLRAALDRTIDADVKSGALSADDAAKVKKTLDQIEGKADGGAGESGAAQSAGAGGAQGAGGGGGGGGSAAKTEKSRTVTVAGNTKTTVITYTDGTSDTATTSATDADRRKYDKHVPQGSAKTAQDYLARMPPGSLIDKAA